MKIGDIYYEKHTVVGISKRTGGVSETDTEIVKVVPIDVLDKILDFIEDNRPTEISTDWERGCAYTLDEIEKIIKENK